MIMLYYVPAGTLFDKAKKSKILKVADFQDFFKRKCKTWRKNATQVIFWWLFRDAEKKPPIRF